MGKLRKLRRQIERNPEAWIDQTSWERRWYSHRPPRCRFAVEGSKGDFMPSKLRVYWHGDGPYQQFVRRVLKDLGYNVR